MCITILGTSDPTELEHNLTLTIHGSLPIGTQSVSSSTNMTRTKQMHKNSMVRAAGAENSFNPVALPRIFFPKLGKKVAEAMKKKCC